METTIQKSNTLAEIELRYKTKVKPSEMSKINSSVDAAEILRPLFDENKIEWIEEAVVIVLNTANKVLGYVKLATGGISGVVVDVRVLMQIAINSNASGIVLAHSHPSGALKASKQDLDLTRKVKEAAKFFDISLLDHIIMTSESYYSLADNGLL